MLKKVLSDKANGTKNALFFLSQAPTHHSFTLHLLFLYKLKHKIRLSIFLFNKMHELFEFKAS